MKFKSYLETQRLDEVLITFGNRPRFGQVVLLGGGAGSGKGFISKKLLGIEGKTFDVDDIKGKIIHPGTPALNKKIFDKYGIDVTKMDLRNPKEVALLHKINDEMGISKKVQKQFFDGIKNTNKEKLPNIIFDTTAKSEKKIKELTDTVKAAGYDDKNIHFIWIMNEHETAVKQNKMRDRVVPEDILTDTHLGVSHTMQNLMKNSRFQEFLDGYVYVVFNKAFVDSTLVFSEYGGSYVEDVLVLEVKKRGKKQISYSEISSVFINKIKKYVPAAAKRLWEDYSGK